MKQMSFIFRVFGPLTLLLAFGVWLGASSLMAADVPTKTPSPSGTTPAAKRNPPFVGVVQKVDIKAGTLTLNGKDGGRVFYVNAETRITKNGQPATLRDAQVGEEAAGTFKDVEGKRYAVSLRLGPKPGATPAPKK